MMPGALFKSVAAPLSLLVSLQGDVDQARDLHGLVGDRLGER
jgi:hypothetical protein